MQRSKPKQNPSSKLGQDNKLIFDLQAGFSIGRFIKKAVIVFGLLAVTVGYVTYNLLPEKHVDKTFAAATYVQSANNNQTGTTSVTATYGSPTTAGNLLIAVVGARANVTINSISGWTQAINQSGTPSQAIFYKVAAGTETSVTATVSGSTVVGLHLYEYSNISGTLNVTGSATGSSNAPSSGTLTTTQTDELIFAAFTQNTNAKITDSSWNDTGEGFTERQDFNRGGAAGNRTAWAGGDNAVNTAGSHSVTIASNRNAAWRGQIVSFLPPPAFDQSAYRLFANQDSTNVGSPLAAQDTAAALANAGDAFRLRALLHVSNTTLALNGQSFKLQYAARSGACDTAFTGETYADVTAATAIAYYNNPTPADGDNLTANANDPVHLTHTTVNQDYEELNPFTNTVAAIPVGQDGQWDFSLRDNGAPANTAYCLRIVKADGGSLDSYTVIPEITMAPPAPTFNQSAYRFFQNKDSTDVGAPLGAQDSTVIIPSSNQAFRLRLLLHSNTAVGASSHNFKLQFATRGTDNLCDAAFSGETYADVTGSSAIAFYNNATPADATAVIANANDPTHGGDTVIAQTYEEANNFTNTNALNTNEDGLWDFALIDNGATKGAHYCFRAVKSNGSALSAYTVVPEIRTRPDMYYVCDSANTLWTLDTVAAGKTLIGGTGVADIEAIAYDSAIDVLYATDAGNFGTLNQMTGAFSLIANVDAAGCANGDQGCISLGDIDGLALDGQTRILWASNRNSSSYDVLFQINPTTGQYIQNAFGSGVDYITIDGTGVYTDIDDLGLRPSDGALFATSNNGHLTTDQLLRVNKFTGVVTVISDIDANDFEGLDYRNNDELWGTRGTADEARQINDQTGVTSNTISLAPSCGDPEAIASMTRPANEVTGTVYDDLNTDANKDPGEPGLSGVIVRLYLDNNSNGTVEVGDLLIQTTTTDAGGNYQFYFYTTGNLVMEVDTNTLPSGYALTTDNAEAASFTDNINYGELDSGNYFGAATGADCDSDGIPDFIEGTIDSDGDGITNQCDLDSDDDGIDDATEFTNDTDNDGVPNYLDLDSDNDGIPDALEANGGAVPTGYNSATGRLSGTDADADGLVDSADSLPAVQYGGSTTTYPLPDSDGDSSQDYLDGDSDNDGLVDCVEAGGTDADNDGLIDGFTDTNSDGYHDPLTTSPLPVPNSDSAYELGASLPLLPDYRDQDSDNDGLDDRREGQSTTGYSVPGFENDNDGDGIIDYYDIDHGGTPIQPVDTDSDLTPDYQDADSDNDGVWDYIEGNDNNFDGVRDSSPLGIDADGDGLDDTFDAVPATYGGGSNLPVQNTDGADELDFRDTNDDNDGFLTANEDFNANNNWADDFTQGGAPVPDYLFFTQPVDLSVVKVVNNSTPDQGNNVTYTITVTNAGPVNATGVEITDLLPAGVTYVSNTPSQGSYVSGTGVWSVGTINNGGNATLQITASVDAGTAGQLITNTATLTAVVQGDSNNTNDSDTADITVTDADLAVVKVVDDASPNEGDTIVYTITVTNNGPDQATNVQVTDLLPAGVTYVSDTPSQGTYVSGTGVWSVGTINNGGSATLQISASVDAGTGNTIITNPVSITAVDQGDSVPGNNSDSQDIDVEQADLSLTKSVDDATPDEGQTITYTLTVANAGPDNATNVQVTDLLPAGVTYVSNTPSQGTYVSGTGVWSVGTINSGANATLQISASVDAGQASNIISNYAEVTASDQADPDSTPNNASTTEDDDDSTDIDVQSADLSLTKAVDDNNPNEGDTITYTLTVANAGPDNATNVQVTDLLPAGVTYVSNTPSQGTYVSGTGVWSVGTINNTATADLQITASVDAGTATQTIINSAAVSSALQHDSDAGNDSDTADLTVLGADLAVSKSVDQSNPTVGQTVNFSVDVENLGPDAGSGIKLSDLLPAGLIYQSDTPSQGIYNSGTGEWDIGSLIFGAGANLALSAQVASGTQSQTLTNTGTITTADQGDQNPGNNSDSESVYPHGVGGTGCYPIGSTSISINDGAATTDRLDVILTFGYLGDATQMIISEDPWFIDASWQPVSGHLPFTLSSGLGSKTVYARFKGCSTGQLIFDDIQVVGELPFEPEIPTPPELPEAPEGPGEESARETCPSCDRLSYDLYIINPDGSQRHMYTGWTRLDYLGEDHFIVNFEDKGEDWDYNDVLVEVDARDCEKITFSYLGGDARWRHQIRFKVFVDGYEQSDVLVWEDRPETVGTTTIVDARNNPEVCSTAMPVPEPCPSCDRLSYDLYIINPDGSERHLNTRWTAVDQLGSNRFLVNFEDKGEDFDYNDVKIEVDAGDCRAVVFTYQGGDASWWHQVRLKVLVDGVERTDILLWRDLPELVGQSLTINAQAQKGVCLALSPEVYQIVERPLVADEFTPVDYSCQVNCADVGYDLYIVNPDGSERHINTKYVKEEIINPGVTLYKFEDRAADIDYNDVWIRVDRRACERLVIETVSVNALWQHEIRLRLLYKGIAKEDLLLWPDSHLAVHRARTLYINDYLDMCVASGLGERLSQSLLTLAERLNIINEPELFFRPEEPIVDSDLVLPSSSTASNPTSIRELPAEKSLAPSVLSMIQEFLSRFFAFWQDCLLDWRRLFLTWPWRLLELWPFKHQPAVFEPVDDFVPPAPAVEENISIQPEEPERAVKRQTVLPTPELPELACSVPKNFNQFLILDTHSDEVRALQTLLQCLGYFPAEESTTGIFGPVTEQAVIKFQQANDLDPVGYVGPATRQSLNAYYQP